MTNSQNIHERPSSEEKPGRAEQNEHLGFLFVSPTIWFVHFLASYLTAAIWCEKFAGPSGSLWTVRVVIGVFTLAALTGIGCTGWCGYRRVNFNRDAMPHDDSTPLDRYRFLGFTALLMSALSMVATVFVAIVLLFVETCD